MHQFVNKATKRIPRDVVSAVYMHHKAANIHATKYNEMCVTVHAMP